jgi:hypothetical protein
MKRLHSKTAVIALIAAASMVPIFTASVQAQPLAANTTSRFQRAQEVLERQIVARQVQLALLGTEVANAANVTTSDRSALVTIITNEQGALGSDATNTAAATTYSGLNTVRNAVVGDERVYAVVTGQVGLVMGADNDIVAEGGYTALTAELGPLVSELGSSYASRLLGTVTSEVTAATALTNTVSAEALALTPSGYPGNKSQIQTWNFQLGRVARDLGVAKGDVKKIEAVALDTHRFHIASPVSATTTSTPSTTTTTS